MVPSSPVLSPVGCQLSSTCTLTSSSSDSVPVLVQTKLSLECDVDSWLHALSCSSVPSSVSISSGKYYIKTKKGYVSCILLNVSIKQQLRMYTNVLLQTLLS